MKQKALLMLLLLSPLLFVSGILRSQVYTGVLIKNTTLAASEDYLPFWFHTNQHGKIELANQFLNLTDFNINQLLRSKEESKPDWMWGTNLIAGLGNNNYWQLNQLFAGITLIGWELKAGLFHDSIRYAGLSTTNGNLVRSSNARAYPSIRFSNTTYKSVPFLGAWLKFKIEYEEGQLNDKRYVDNAHIHHKSLYFLINPRQSWAIQAGLEHFVMWGGESIDEEIGKLPAGFQEYLRAVFALPGSKEAPIHDQLNVAGNQLGTYQLEFVKRTSNLNLSIYLSHPFENDTGVYWLNWPDNLLGLHLKFKKEESFVTNIVYEFTNTKHQGVDDSLYVFDEASNSWRRQLNENYFLNEIYKTGYTYHENVLGSPLFLPVVQRGDVSNTNWYAIRSTRFWSHHIGINGNFSENIQWTGLFTYVQHLGTYKNPYSNPETQFSGFFEVQYSNPGFPIKTAFSIALDQGNNISNNFGIQISLAKSW